MYDEAEKDCYCVLDKVSDMSILCIFLSLHIIRPSVRWGKGHCKWSTSKLVFPICYFRSSFRVLACRRVCSLAACRELHFGDLSFLVYACDSC